MESVETEKELNKGSDGGLEDKRLWGGSIQRTSCM